MDYLCNNVPETFTPLSRGFHLVGEVYKLYEEEFKKIMTERQVNTFLFVPIFDNDFFWGFLGFEHCMDVVWDLDVIESIKLITKNISIKINEVRYKEKIGPSFDIFKYYDNGILEGFWELDLVTNELKLSNNWANLLGFQFMKLNKHMSF